MKIFSKSKKKSESNENPLLQKFVETSENIEPLSSSIANSTVIHKKGAQGRTKQKINIQETYKASIDNLPALSQRVEASSLYSKVFTSFILQNGPETEIEAKGIQITAMHYQEPCIYTGSKYGDVKVFEVSKDEIQKKQSIFADKFGIEGIEVEPKLGVMVTYSKFKVKIWTQDSEKLWRFDKVLYFKEKFDEIVKVCFIDLSQELSQSSDMQSQSRDDEQGYFVACHGYLDLGEDDFDDFGRVNPRKFSSNIQSLMSKSNTEENSFRGISQEWNSTCEINDLEYAFEFKSIVMVGARGLKEPYICVGRLMLGKSEQGRESPSIQFHYKPAQEITENHSAPVTSIELSPTDSIHNSSGAQQVRGYIMVTGSLDHSIVIWRQTQGSINSMKNIDSFLEFEYLQALSDNQSPITSLALSKNSNQILAGFKNSEVKQFSRFRPHHKKSTHKHDDSSAHHQYGCTMVYQKHEDLISNVLIVEPPDQPMFLSSSFDGTVKIVRHQPQTHLRGDLESIIDEQDHREFHITRNNDKIELEKEFRHEKRCPDYNLTDDNSKYLEAELIISERKSGSLNLQFFRSETNDLFVISMPRGYEFYSLTQENSQTNQKITKSINLIFQVKDTRNRSKTVAFNSNNGLIALSRGPEGHVEVYKKIQDFSNEARIELFSSIRTKRERIQTLRFLPGGEDLLIGFKDSDPVLYKLNSATSSYKVHQEFDCLSKTTIATALAKNSSELLLISSTSKIVSFWRYFDSSGNYKKFEEFRCKGLVTELSFNRDNRFIVFGVEGNGLLLYKRDSKRKTFKVQQEVKFNNHQTSGKIEQLIWYTKHGEEYLFSVHCLVKAYMYEINIWVLKYGKLLRMKTKAFRDVSLVQFGHRLEQIFFIANKIEVGEIQPNSLIVSERASFKPSQRFTKSYKSFGHKKSGGIQQEFNQVRKETNKDLGASLGPLDNLGEQFTEQEYGQSHQRVMRVLRFEDSIGIDISFDVFKKFKKLFSSQQYFVSEEQFLSLLAFFDEITSPEDLEEGRLTQVRNSVFGKLGKRSNKHEIEWWTEQLLSIHSKHSLLLYAIYSQHEIAVKECLERFGYEQYFYPENYDPIDIALAYDSLKSVDYRLLLDVLAEYFEERRDLFSCYFSRQRFYTMMRCSSNRLRQLAYDTFFSQGETIGGVVLPKLMPVPPTQRYLLFEHSVPFKDQTLKEILDVRSRELTHPFVKVSYRTIPFQLDLVLGYKFTQDFLSMMMDVPDYFIKADLRFIVREIWMRSKKIIWLYTIMNWLNIVFFCLEIVWQVTNSWVTIPSIATSFFMVGFEWLIAIKNPRRYFSTGYKVIDFYQYHCVPIIQILDKVDTIDQEDLIVNFWVNITLIIMGFRSLTMFQNFDPVRYFLSCILQVFSDIRSFALFLSGAILSLSVIHVNALKTENEFTGSLSEFGRAVDLVYNICFGVWDDSNVLNPVKYTNFFISTIFLVVIMMSIVIVTIEEIFLGVREKKDLVDVKQMINILSDFGDFLSYFVTGERAESSGEKGYSHLVISQEEGDKELDEMVDGLREEMESRFEDLEKQFDDRFMELKSSFFSRHESEAKQEEISDIDLRKKLETVLKENATLKQKNGELEKQVRSLSEGSQ